MIAIVLGGVDGYLTVTGRDPYGQPVTLVVHPDDTAELAVAIATAKPAPAGHHRWRPAPAAYP